MPEKFSKFFTSDALFLTVSIASCVCFLASSAKTLTADQPDIFLYFYAIVSLVMFFSVMFLYISYKNHEKNVMKGLMGMLFGVLFSADMFTFINSIRTDSGIFTLIVLLVIAIFDILIIFNHFVINSDHHSSPAKVMDNQVLLIIYFVLTAVSTVPEIIACAGASDIVFTVLDALAYLCCVAVIICIESRLDAYRVRREANGWTPDMSR